MKGLVYHGPDDIRFDTVPDPVPHDVDGAVVQVTACSICGSDLHIYHGHTVRERGFCVGHEAIGEVVEAGSGVRRFVVGDRVLLPAGTGCNRCAPCLAGDIGNCELGLTNCYGLGHRLQGSQAQAVAVPFADTNLVRIPEGMSDDNALLLTDCASTAWYGVSRARVAVGASVAVIGLGPIGQVGVMAAQLQGAARVFGVDPVAERRARAESLGAVAVDPSDAGSIVEATKGRGVDAVIEYVGRDDTINQALDLVRRGGSVSVIGVSWNNRFTFPLARVQLKSIDFWAGMTPVNLQLPVLTKLILSDRFDPSFVISHRLGLSAGRAAYELSSSRAEGVSKIVLDPTS